LRSPHGERLNVPMLRYRAAWVLPISGPPIRNGWVDVADGRVLAIGPVAVSAQRNPQATIAAGSAPAASDDGGERQGIDLGAVAILPGLVNAHTHLELSRLRGRVPPTPEFTDWIRNVMHERRLVPNEPEAPIAAAIEEALACGTALIGDIGNTPAAVRPLADSRLSALVFSEVIDFRAADPDETVARGLRNVAQVPRSERLRGALAIHAPYSVAADLIRRVGNLRGRAIPSISSVHLAESSAEIEFLSHGAGPCRDLLRDLGVWNSGWEPPSCRPAEYLDRLGFLIPGTLVVHGVHLTDAELALLRTRGAVLVTCPRSNVWTGAGEPPVARFYRSGVPVAIGTDSLASVPDLNLFAELQQLRRLAPGVPASTLLDSATRQGARVLGFEQDFGTIDSGRRAALIAVEVPPDAGDVEEYLVRGIEPGQVRWLDASW
jgi:aminodeoxyfutalosine deaminase